MKFIFTIGIATKNRWTDLKLTLTKIRDFGWHEVPTLIFDDFSDEPCPFNPKEILINSDIKRFSDSKGYIIRRNQLTTCISTPYYLSLDDDSYPAGGSIQEALNLMITKSDIFCSAFPIYNPIQQQYQVESLRNQPYQVRSFTGCAHILDIAKFNSLKGYREELIHQGEEMDIAVRAFKKGWKCFHSPALLVHHNMSNNSRNWNRMDYFGARNNILWNDWYLPHYFKILVQIKNITSRIILSIKLRRKGQITGMIDGVRKIGMFKKYREELNMTAYRRWQRLPNS